MTIDEPYSLAPEEVRDKQRRYRGTGSQDVMVRLPWAGWAFWPWLHYTLRWKGWRAKMADNAPLLPGQRGWKLHRCADGAQCREAIGGGCAAGWCAHCGVRPDECGVPRFPRSSLLPPINSQGAAHG